MMIRETISLASMGRAGFERSDRPTFDDLSTSIRNRSALLMPQDPINIVRFAIASTQ